MSNGNVHFESFQKENLFDCSVPVHHFPFEDEHVDQHAPSRERCYTYLAESMSAFRDVSHALYIAL